MLYLWQFPGQEPTGNNFFRTNVLTLGYSHSSHGKHAQGSAGLSGPREVVPVRPADGLCYPAEPDAQIGTDPLDEQP